MFDLLPESMSQTAHYLVYSFKNLRKAKFTNPVLQGPCSGLLLSADPHTWKTSYLLELTHVDPVICYIFFLSLSCFQPYEVFGQAY